MTPMPQAPAAPLALALHQAHSTFTQVLDHELGIRHGLSLADVALLGALQEAPDQTLSRTRLAATLALSPAQLVRTGRPLEKIGLLAREPDPGNPGIGRYRLPPAGLARLLAAQETLFHLERPLRTALGSTATQALVVSLAKLRQHLR